MTYGRCFGYFMFMPRVRAPVKTKKRPVEVVLAMGPGASQRTLLKHLRRSFTIGARRTTRDEITYYDTFDWRLDLAGRRLAIQGRNDHTLLSLGRAGPHEARVLPVEKVPSFASDLPSGVLRRKLTSITGVRRLLPVVEVEVRSSHHPVLDGERKTVARIVFEQARARAPVGEGVDVALPCVLRVQPVSGYRKAHAAILANLKQRSGLTLVDRDVAARALAALGSVPQARRTGLEVQLDPDAPIGAAFVALQRGLFESMRINEPGIREDLDSEYLHDYRIACRRTRLLHGIFRKVIRASAFESLVPRIKWIRKVTGATRDLDVQLLELATEREALGETLDALLPLEALLRDQRHAEWSKLSAALESAEYAELHEMAVALLDLPETPEAVEVARRGPPLGPWASRRIARAARRLISLGRRINDDSPDSEIHALRLESKRLRYLLEFFRSIYPDSQIKKLIKELKRLQDNLGAFNDACVRVELLRALARGFGQRGPGGADALVAVGRLVERSENRKHKERVAFSRRFERFDTRENRVRLRRLFGRRIAKRAKGKHHDKESGD